MTSHLTRRARQDFQPLNALRSTERSEWRGGYYADDEKPNPARVFSTTVIQSRTPEPPPYRYPSQLGVFSRGRGARPGSRSPSPCSPTITTVNSPCAHRSTTPDRDIYLRPAPPAHTRARSPLSRVASPIGAKPASLTQMWTFQPVVEDPDDDVPPPILPMRTTVLSSLVKRPELSLNIAFNRPRRSNAPLMQNRSPQTPDSPISAALERNHLWIQAAEFQHKALVRSSVRSRFHFV